VDGYVTTPVAPFHTAVGASFGTFTTRQDVSPLPVPVILPYQLRIGTRIKIEAEGEFSSTATPTIVLGFYIGSGFGASGAPSAITTVLAESSAISLATAAAWPWRMEWRGLVTALGTSGQLVGQGDVEAGTSLTAFTSSAIPTTQALRTLTFNQTVANAVGVCATFSASSASNTVKVNNMSVLLLN
jgi:hypothetical protein